VRDDDGKFLTHSEVGEILIRTPRIMKGYAGRKDDSALPDGWRATGDLGWVDEDGYVFFAGRKDDMIIRGGENIAPAEIETVLMSHPAVDEAAVIGMPSVEWGQTVKALWYCARAKRPTVASIQEFCRTRLASFKRPETIEFIEALPKNRARQNPAQGAACAKPGASLTAAGLRLHRVAQGRSLLPTAPWQLAIPVQSKSI
jgi:long-chain acyl-CoA synthetase